MKIIAGNLKRNLHTVKSGNRALYVLPKSKNLTTESQSLLSDKTTSSGGWIKSLAFCQMRDIRHGGLRLAILIINFQHGKISADVGEFILKVSLTHFKNKFH